MLTQKAFKRIIKEIDNEQKQRNRYSLSDNLLKKVNEYRLFLYWKTADSNAKDRYPSMDQDDLYYSCRLELFSKYCQPDIIDRIS